MAKTSKSSATKKKAPAKKAAAKKSPTKKKAAAAKSPAKSSSKPAKKSAPAKKAPAKTAAKKAPAKKTTAKKTPSKKASVSKSSSTTKKSSSKSTKSPFDKKFLDEMKGALLEERSRYVYSAESLKAEADALVESREPGDVQFDEESGEGDTLAVERERDLALSAHARQAVEEIDAALERLEQGTYGICVVSEKPIPKERLRAIPWAAERVEYKAGGFGLR